MPGELQHTLSTSEKQIVKDIIVAGGVSALGGGPAAGAVILGIGNTIASKSPSITVVNRYATGSWQITHTLSIPTSRQIYLCTPFGGSASIMGADWIDEFNIDVKCRDTAGAAKNENFRFLIWDMGDMV